MSAWQTGKEGDIMREREGYRPEQIRNLSWDQARSRLNRLQNEVFEYLEKHNSATTEKIAEGLNRRISSITARIKELRELEIVELKQHSKSEITGRSVCVWQIRYPEQDTLPFDWRD